MKLSELLTDEVVLFEMGERIAKYRIDLNMTQDMLAVKAGVSKRTVERIESGQSTQLSNFIRILRGLELFSRLEILLPELKPGPIELLKNQGRNRKRVRPYTEKPDQKKPWTWGDES